MWLLIKSEIRYTWIFIFAFAILMSLVYLYEWIAGDVPPMPFFILLFLIVQNTLAFKNKEKRERYFVNLPVTYSAIALARIAMPVLYMLSLYSVYLLMDVSINKEIHHHNLFPFLTSLCIIISILSIYFITRDFVLQKLRDLGITKERMKVGLVATIGGLNVLGIVTFIQASGSDETPWLLRILINVIENYLPFMPDAILWPAISVTVVLAAGSVFSFCLSKAHLE